MTDTRLPSLHLPPPRLDWNAAGWPESRDYGDVYFSKADALGESSHVFLAGNALPARFAALSAHDFVILELGFGSGLNFLNTWRLWRQTAPRGARLHYVSCELHPLSRDELERLHAQWPELASESAALRAQYPEHSAGLHQLRLGAAEHPLWLTLLYGDAHAMLTQLCCPSAPFVVDALFLDGFSPKRNPALWHTELLQQIARFCTPATTLATYSVAASVRQVLEQSGFNVEKAPGFAHKRHMLRGEYRGVAEASTRTPRGTLAIVGGGLAGCSSAFALAESGWRVTLFERNAALASAASGNPQGILHFRPVKRQAPDSHFNLYAYLHATRHYQALAHAVGLRWHPCGHLQLATTAALRQRFAAILEESVYPSALLHYLDRDAASAKAGVPLQYPALFFPDSGWLSPPELCTLYAAHPNITLATLSEVHAFRQDRSGWRLHTNAAAQAAQQHFDRIILANSSEAALFPELGHLPFISNRGQVDVYSASADSTVHTIVCGQSYLVPGDNVQCLGGSYYLGDDSPAAVSARQHWHLEQLRDACPTLGQALATRRPLQARRASRCITPDRLPLVGALDAERYPNLYLNLAHGSHGLTRTPLCAAWLTSQINATPPPCLPLLGELLNPARYPQ
ncbi:MAG: bifunctional tRNA (5-methylaminomethyl-2-thiouridine)(34)-methyltransferase MnmD/FAD-dependent 5-carboxymethylaminomethyl-2-thiouridine(34) oxidoreductase MnmC [Pseudomonadales bacterium]|jgi:tRNA 5-methylaminomethyl-2-thiouridine biosynthesis bifunctional protein|nr:bifunctional tRNA (5-methylaminomethyl-2-thiouridine)(34)-methyltransferase MnmD/FAD-dependent 5-carboxymethylaminomethyl-2-thiouridine(34) oxidoreductase MnmC [Pseudomonadales bacterium]